MTSCRPASRTASVALGAACLLLVFLAGCGSRPAGATADTATARNGSETQPSISNASEAKPKLLPGAKTKVLDRAGDKPYDKTFDDVRFDIKPGEHPIVPIMLYDARLAQAFAARLLEEGVYVTGFFYPVVAKGNARIRVQLSAAHEKEHIDRAIGAFTKVGHALGVLQPSGS